MVCLITVGSVIMNVWVTGKVMWSSIFASLVDVTDTFPSSGPGIKCENYGFVECDPAITPSGNCTAGKWVTYPVVDNDWAAGPFRV